MKTGEFNILVAEFFGECQDILDKATLDYATENDRLANFKELAIILDTTPGEVLMVYFMKHLISIRNYYKGRQSNREDIRGRFKDAVNYLILGLALVEEERDAKQGSSNLT